MKDRTENKKNDMVENTADIQNRAKIEKQKLEKRLLIDKERVKKVVKSAIHSLDKTTIEVNSALKSI